MEIHKLYIEESKINPGRFIVVATTLDAKTFVLSGDALSPTYAIPYENALDAKELPK